jgi:lipoprotein-releasing system permease protein
LNLSYFISKRIRHEQAASFSSIIHKIAIASIAIGLAASIVAFLVMKGFQDTVKNKIYSFSGNIILTQYTLNNSPEEQAMNFHIPIYDHPEDFPFIYHTQEFAHKAGLIKTNEEVFGIVLKGVGKSFDTAAFKSSITEGNFITFPDSGYSNQLVISRVIADKLGAKVNDNIVVHFFQNPPRFRKLTITGIYETNLSEYFDSKIIIGDIRLIQRLNDWPDSVAGGLEVFIKDPDKAMAVGEEIGQTMDHDLYIELASQKYIQVFEWLNLLSRQVNILLVIILAVIVVNMISIVLILVMERTQMIGMLKALGAGNGLVRSVFIYQGMSLILKGLVFGNLLGLGLCYIQHVFKIIKLNPHDYYMSFVPISWHWGIVGLLNLLMFSIVTVVLMLLTMVISRINPIRAIKFD